MSVKSSSDGTNGAEPERIYLGLLTSYALAIEATWLACSQLQVAISRLAQPKSPRVHLSVVCGRPVSGLSSTAGAKLKVVGK
jgi:hypothetical protein